MRTQKMPFVMVNQSQALEVLFQGLQLSQRLGGTIKEIWVSTQLCRELIHTLLIRKSTFCQKVTVHKDQKSPS